MIGEYNNNGISLRADYLVGDTRASLSLGIRTNKQGCDFPVSLIKESIKKVTCHSNRVWAIFRKKVGEEYYTEIAFRNSKTDLDSLSLPKKVKITDIKPVYSKQSI